jgi:hypothetical protein
LEVITGGPHPFALVSMGVAINEGRGVVSMSWGMPGSAEVSIEFEGASVQGVSPVDGLGDGSESRDLLQGGYGENLGELGKKLEIVHCGLEGSRARDVVFSDDGVLRLSLVAG